MHTRHPSAPRRRAAIFSAAALTLLAVTPPTLRADETWDGGGVNFANSNFSDPANWAFDTLPPNDGTANLVFTGATNMSPSVDTDWSVNSVTFNATPYQFILYGPATLTVGAGGVTNNTTAAQTIRVPIATSASTTFNATAGPLSVDTVSLAAKSTFTFNAAAQSTLALLSGSGNLVKTGTDSLALGGLAPNTYTGTTTVNAGTLFLTKPAKTVAVPGPLTVNLGGTVRLNANSQISDAAPITLNAGTLDLQTFAQTTTSPLSMTDGSITGTGTLSLLADLSTGPAVLSSTISSPLKLGDTDRTFTVADGAAAYDLDISGPITNYNGVVTKTGPGTLRLSGPSTNAVTFNVKQGTLLLNKAAGPDTGGDLTLSGSGSLSATHDNSISANATVALSTSGSFAVGSTAMRSLTITAVGSLGPGTYTLYNAVGNALTLGPGVSLPNSLALATPTGGGILYAGTPASPAPSSVAGPVDLGNAARTVSVQATSADSNHDDLTLAGALSNGALAVSTPNFDGSARGILSLTAPNTYAGGTSATNAILHVSSDANLGAPTGPLTLSNAVLRSSTSFSTARPITLNTPAGLYPDTGTTLTLTGPLSGPGTLVLSSPGTLVLPAATSLSGGISVATGTLVPTSPASLGTGTLTLNSGGTFRPAGTSPVSFPNPLTLRSPSLNPSTVDGPDTTFTGPTTIAGPSTLTVNNNLTLAGIIGDNAGAFGLTKRGTGTLTLTSHNVFSGPLTIEQGAVTLPALSANGYVVNYATLNAGGFAAIVASLNNYATLNLIGGELTLSSFNNFAPVTLPPNFTLYTSNTGSGVNNQSTLTLNNATVTGPTPLVNQGTLTGLGTVGASSFTNTGQLTPAGPLSLSSTGPMTNTGSIDLPTASTLNLYSPLSSAGTITLSGGTLAGPAPLTLSPGSVLTGHGSLYAPVTNAGTIAPAGGTLYLSSPLTNTGLIQLSSPTTSITGNTIAPITNAGTIQGAGSIGNPLTNSPAGVIEALDGTLSLPNLASNQGLLAAAAGNKLLLPALASNDGTLSLSGGTLDTNAHPLTNNATLAGFGTLRASPLTNNSTITLTGGPSTLNTPLTNNPGATVKILYNPALFTGPVTNNGTLTITNTTATFALGITGNAPSEPSLSLSTQNSALNTSSLAGTLTLSPGSSVLTNYIRQDTLTSSGSFTLRPTSQGGAPSTLNILTLLPNSSFDLADNPLTLLTTASATLRSYLLSHELLSSLSDPTHSLGYLFSGDPTAPTSLTIKLTLLGDTNLDGAINADDYALLDKSFAAHTTNALWWNGDFNYDGTIDQNDYLLIDRTLTLQSNTYTPSATLLAQRQAQFGPAYVQELITSIPEPASPLACLFATSLLPRRRRHPARPTR